MTKLTVIAALALAITGASLATTTSASATPTYGFSVSDGGSNPFKAVNGR